jgi:signal transduction histidine kinase/ActR/RegA family two-component response regulator
MNTRHADSREEIETLRLRLAEAENTLQAIQQGEIDALVVEGNGGPRVHTLHSAEEPFRDLVEKMDEGAVALTKRGDILYYNARFAALVGEPLTSVVGRRFNRFVSAADRDDFDALLAAGSGRRRSRLLATSSGPFEVSLSLTTVRSAHGDRRNLIVTDMTELLEAHSNRDRAQRDSRTKDEFLATLAHELRNPLSAISAAVHVLKVTHAPEEAVIRAHGVIARQVGHITHLIGALLDIERVVSGKIQLNRQPLDMAEAVRRAVATFAADDRLDRHIDVSIEMEPAWVDGDAVRIEQVLVNVLTNAVKYTPPGARIGVALRADGDDAVLIVEDSGFGISPELLPFIFDIYVQGNQTVEHARGGLGIGLALVRRLVELHGGTITASSAGEGHGSRFTIRLCRIPTTETPAGPSFRQERCAARRRVLLIEDSDEAREMLRMALELEGHVVYDAADGVRGLKLLDVARPDVGIIDVSLPIMDGYQVARRIREEPLGRDMLLLALTGYGSPGDAVHLLQNGFDHHLVKPVDPDYLSRLISGAVQGA